VARCASYDAHLALVDKLYNISTQFMFILLCVIIHLYFYICCIYVQYIHEDDPDRSKYVGITTKCVKKFAVNKIVDIIV